MKLHPNVRPPYALHPSYRHIQAGLDKLPERTGKDFVEWLAAVDAAGLADAAARREWFQRQPGITASMAGFLAERSLGRGTPEDYDPIAEENAQFPPAKAGLRPLYDALFRLITDLGSDVRVSPCQTMIPFYRKHVFAQVKIATRQRIDVGLALKDRPFTERLLDTGGLAKKDRITHKFGLTSLIELDDEVRAWLREAYELDT